MSNSNNIELSAASNIRGTIIRNHSPDSSFVVKDVYITNADGQLMERHDEVYQDAHYDHTMILIPTADDLPTAIWIMKLSDTECNPSASFTDECRDTSQAGVSYKTFFADKNKVRRRLNIDLTIAAGTPSDTYGVCVVMCTPQHALRVDNLYTVTARGTISFEQTFGQWSFSWQNLPPNTSDVVAA